MWGRLQLSSILVCMVLISGCDSNKNPATAENQEQEKNNYAAKHKELIEYSFDQSTPEALIKSIWTYSDKLRASYCYDEKSFSENAAEAKSMLKIYSGTALEVNSKKTNYTQDECVKNLSIYERTIIKSEKQSDSRTVIYFNSKNITPIPTGADMDEYDQDWRRDGQDFKVDFAKEGDVWVIDQVYDRRFSQEWTPKYSKKDLMPDYPSSVFEQLP